MATRRYLVRAALGAALLTTAGYPRTAAWAAGDVSAARAYVGELGARALAVLTSSSPASGREQQLGDLLRQGFDLDYLARLAAGRAWRDMSAGQRDGYQAAFGAWLLKTYAARLQHYGGQAFAVTGADAAGESDAMVRSEIRGGGRPIRLDWRVRRSGAGWRIIDVVIEGVSMVVTHRNEFQAILQRQGIDGLIGNLQQRAAQAQAA